MIQLLKNTLAIQTESYNTFRMFAYIIRFLTKNHIPFFVYDGSIYATKGDGKNGFPCIVSHTDTVHEIAENLTVIEKEGVLFGYNMVSKEITGIGGDDKVGIFIALQLLLNTDNLKAVFFRDEEVGCVGSSNAYLKFFDDVNFCLQYDRKGNKDFVTNAAGIELSSKAFRKSVKSIISQYGYSFCPNGGLTDVAELKGLGVNISMANISCGYYNPHQSNEYVIMKDVFNAYKMGLNIINNLKCKFPHKEEKRGFYKGYYRDTKKTSGKTATKIQNPVWEEEIEYCGICGVSNDWEFLKTYNDDDTLCPYCAAAMGYIKR